MEPGLKWVLDPFSLQPGEIVLAVCFGLLAFGGIRLLVGRSGTSVAVFFGFMVGLASVVLFAITGGTL